MMEWEYELLISPLGPSINFLSALPHSEMNCKVTHTHRKLFFLRKTHPSDHGKKKLYNWKFIQVPQLEEIRRNKSYSL